MKDDLTFSLRINNDVSVDDFVAMAQRAEQAGFDQVWLSNDLLMHSALVGLTVAAMRTHRIKLGTGILNPYSMHPAEIAMFALTFSTLADGRLLLGIAAGAEDFLSWVGIERARPMATTRAAIVALRHLIEGDAHTPDGWTADSYLRVQGGEQPVPIYLGAMSPRMMAMAGELADGVLPLLFPPERYVEARAQISAGAQAHGRSIEDIDVPVCVWCSIDDDSATATSALAIKVAYYGPSFSPSVLGGLGLTARDLEPARAALANGDLSGAERLLPSAALSLGIAGNADEVIERISRLLDLGADHVSFGPPLGPNVPRAIALLHSKVLPAVRRSMG